MSCWGHGDDDGSVAFVLAYTATVSHGLVAHIKDVLVVQQDGLLLQRVVNVGLKVRAHRPSEVAEMFLGCLNASRC
jgi:hypothetical protein